MFLNFFFFFLLDVKGNMNKPTKKQSHVTTKMTKSVIQYLAI